MTATRARGDHFNIRAARLNRGYTIRGLAREVGIAEQTLRRLEDGEGAHPANAKKVADFFGVTVMDILGEHDA